ncbi:MAG: phytanoyl-CoA dioxygenase family protein [Phycisphaeraceae bacterium]
MSVHFGHRELDAAASLPDLRDSSPLLSALPALCHRLLDDGYLLLRGLIRRERVIRAREIILEHVAEREALAPGTPVLDGVMPAGARAVAMMGRKGIAHHPDVLAALEAPELVAFWEAYFGEPALTFDYKWLRAVGREQFTGAHMDVVYMGQGSPRLHTTWIPLGDIPVEQGTLAIVPGSHRAPGYARLRQTYGRSDVDRDNTPGWFTDDPLEITETFGGQWHTADVAMGDVIVFGMHTVHASTTNTTDRYRLSCDVRFQPAADPVDPRWGGDNPTGHRADAQPRPRDEVRAEWGL